MSRYSEWMRRTAEEFSFRTNTSETVTGTSIDISNADIEELSDIDEEFGDDFGYSRERDEEYEMGFRSCKENRETGLSPESYMYNAS